MPDLSASSWNENDPQNNVTPPSGWPEGQMPSTVNDCARMMMGALKRMWNRLNPTITAWGSAGAYTYATANTLFPSAYQQGEAFVFKAGFTSVGNDTLAINSLIPLPIYSRTGSGTLGRVAAGDIQYGEYVTVAYDVDLNGGAGGFQLITGNAAPISNPSFSGNLILPANSFVTWGNTGNAYINSDGAGNMGLAAGGGAGTFYVTGNELVSGNLSVEGNLNTAGTLGAGNIISDANLTAAANLIFSANILGPSQYTLFGPGGTQASVINIDSAGSTFTGNLAVGGGLSVSGEISSAGEITCADLVSSVGTIGGVTFPGSGAINSGAISCTTLTTNSYNLSCGGLQAGSVSCADINSNGRSITSGGITCTSINTQGYQANLGTVVAGSVTCGSINSQGQDVVTGNTYPSVNGGYYSGVGSLSWAAVYSYAYPGASGRQLKRDITDASAGALEQVLALRTVKFRWKDGPDDKLHHGFIADEAAEVLGRDFGGYHRSEDSEALDKTEMVCVLWQAVQELTARLKALEAR